MKKATLISILLFISFRISAQTAITWSAPVVISSVNGYNYPRICLSNSNPVITWGDNSNQTLMMSRQVAGSFTAPLQISPAGFGVSAFSISGPEVVAKGDTVYVTYVDGASTHAYLQRSLDGGNSFSDTIQVDSSGTDLIEYPAIAIQDDGNPIISFARINTNFTNPQYAVAKSTDAGASFLPDVSATATLSADPCDCCPGSIAANGNKVVVIYRNAINDVRDFRCAISTDMANTFSTFGMIDINNWVIANCPSSGGRGLFKGDTLISVFMNGLTGAYIYVSTYNVVTQQMGFERKIFDAPGTSQNTPRIAGHGDTLGVVWTQIINGSIDILFSYSITGVAGLGNYIDTITLASVPGFYGNPDIDYANGKFHIVYSDGASQVFYTMGDIGTSSAIETLDKQNFNLFLSDDNALLNIFCNAEWNEKTDVTIYDVDGKLIEHFQANDLQKNHQFKLHNTLTSGIYVVNLNAKHHNTSKKLQAYAR